MKSLLSILLLTLLTLVSPPSRAQIARGAILSNEYNKDVSLYRAKEYVMQEVLGLSESPERFEVWALAAASSGELTSLVYKSVEKKKEGLLLAFYGNKWNDAGASYKAYAFKDLPKERAEAVLGKLEATVENNLAYLNADPENNNISFQYDDMTFLVSANGTEPRIRVFWGQFDSSWDISSFRKTKRRMAKKI